MKEKGAKEQEKVLEYLRQKKGRTTIFWVTETQARARAVDALEASGRLKRDYAKEPEHPHVWYEDFDV